MIERSPTGRYILGPGHILIPCTSIEDWGRALADDTANIVQQDVIAPGIAISTVFLGLDHNMFGDGPPLVFETMIFREGDGNETFRWSTWDEAMEGHKALTEALRLLIAQTPTITIGGTLTNDS